MKTIVATVNDALIEGGSMTNSEIADMTGLTTQRVATGLNQLKHNGVITKQKVKGSQALWHLVAPPVKVSVKPAFDKMMPLIPILGDLFEVVGIDKDGVTVVRTIEAPNSLYTIKEV